MFISPVAVTKNKDSIVTITMSSNSIHMILFSVIFSGFLVLVFFVEEYLFDFLDFLSFSFVKIAFFLPQLGHSTTINLSGLPL